MIEIFSPNNKRFDATGDMTIFPTLCDVDAGLDKVWSLNLKHPIDKDRRGESIETNAVIKAPSFNGEQLFRIRKVQKMDSGVIAYARPIWMDAQNEVFILDIRPTNKNGQEALNDILKTATKYKGISNILTKNTAYYVLKNAVEAIMGNENSFLNRWGGEVSYDNYVITINERIGSDNGVELLYGKNIPVDGLSETVDMDNVVTRIIPKAYNGRTLPGETPWVDSTLINEYPMIRTKVIEYPNIRLFEDVDTIETDGLIICETLNELYSELRKAALNEYQNGIDKPKVSIKCKMVLLQNTEEYKNFKDIEYVSLGDTVYCNHSKLNIVSTARVTELTWDCIKKQIKNVTIGEASADFISRVSSSVYSTEKALTKDGSVKASQIEGVINMGTAQLKYETNGTTAQTRPIVFEDTDPTSEFFGAIAIGSNGIEVSDKRNDDNTDWIYNTAITAKGLLSTALIAQDKLEVAKHFFVDENGFVHITEEPGEYNIGSNILLRGSSMEFRKDTVPYVSINNDGSIELGSEDYSKLKIDQSSLNVQAGGVFNNHGSISVISAFHANGGSYKLINNDVRVWGNAELPGYSLYSDSVYSEDGNLLYAENAINADDKLVIGIHPSSGGTGWLHVLMTTDNLSLYSTDETTPFFDLSIDGTLNVSGNNFTNNKRLTITRTENTYVNSTSIGRLYAYERSGFLWFNGNLQITSDLPSGGDFIEIAKISDWSSPVSCYGTIPMQNGTGVLTLMITSAGSIQIYNGSGNDVRGFARLSLIAPKA